jgi:hypothetical protein
LIEDAQGARKFLAAVGHGLNKSVPQIAGTWRLPFGEIDLKAVGVNLVGTAEVTKEESGFGNILGMPGEKTIKTEIYTFEGTFTGTVCKFTVRSKISGANLYSSLAALGGGSKSREGFIVFDDGDKWGTYAEVKDTKVGKREVIVRIK